MFSFTTIPTTTLSKPLHKPKLFTPHQFQLKLRPATVSYSAATPQQEMSPSSSLKAFFCHPGPVVILLSTPLPAMADIVGLTPCKESKAFAKREKQLLKKLEAALKKYDPESAPALAIKATMEKTKHRFENYGKFGLLCGDDGLTHLIVSSDQRHWGEFITLGLIFLYIASWIGWVGCIANWIGWVGCSYLIAIRDDKKPTQKEIIIDVPLASNLLFRATENLSPMSASPRTCDDLVTSIMGGVAAGGWPPLPSSHGPLPPRLHLPP